MNSIAEIKANFHSGSNLTQACLITLAIIVFYTAISLILYLLYHIFWGSSATVKDVGVVVLGMIAAPFGFWRLTIHDKQAELIRQQRINEMLTKGVELLCSCRQQETKIEDEDGNPTGKETITVPNREIRLGAVRILQEVYNTSTVEREVEREAVYDILAGVFRRADDDEKNAYTKHRSEESIERYVINLPSILHEKRQALTTIADKNRPKTVSVDFSKCYFGKANIDKLGFNNFTLNQTTFAGIKATTCTFDRCEFGKSSLESATFKDCSFSAAVISDSLLEQSHFNQCKLDKLVFNFCDLQNSKFDQCTGSDLVFKNCDLSDVTLCGSATCGDSTILKITSFEDCFLYNTTFENADLSFCDFSNAYLFGVDLSNTNIQQNQINKITVARNITLPQGLTIPNHWNEILGEDESIPLDGVAADSKLLWRGAISLEPSKLN